MAGGRNKKRTYQRPRAPLTSLSGGKRLLSDREKNNKGKGRIVTT